jgi:hypothetical protein
MAAGEVSRQANQHGHAHADDAVAVFATAKNFANGVIEHAKHQQKSQRHGNRHTRRPVHARFIDQIGAGIPQVRHREQRKAGQPGAVGLPIKPVQMRRQLRRLHRVFDRVIKPAAVHRPQLAGRALAFEFFIDGRRQAGVEKDEIKRGAYPRDGSDDMSPAQQQVGPVEKVAFHDGQSIILLTTAGALSKVVATN